MRLTWYLLLVVLVSCQFKRGNTVGPDRVLFGFINDYSRYADGCELYIEQDKDSLSVQASQYKPSASSLYTVKRAQLSIAPGQVNPNRVPVKVLYRETGKRVIIHCGWVSPTVPEIDILEITKR
ncbi:hypothetical protein GCM10028818_38690 [Spirosoma horti]